MSDVHERQFDTLLLDLHLGHLSAAEQAELRRRIAGDPQLAAQDRALASVFEALRAVPDRQAPLGLCARIVASVRAAGRAPRVVRPRDEITEALERSSQRVIRLGNLRDVVAVAAMLVLAIGLGVPGLLHMRERSDRLGCSNHLRQLGVGVQQYALTFGSALPFAGWAGSDCSWQPSDDPGVQTVPNRRHIYPLLRLAYVADPRLFVCPAQNDVPMPRDEVLRHDDFIEGRNVSYAYQNMAGVRPSTNDDPQLVILGDDNPLFADGMPLFDARRLPWSDRATSNSHAHDGAGQNVLTLAGQVKWLTTPLGGVDGDNIWILRDTLEYTGREGPAASTDSHLLK